MRLNHKFLLAALVLTVGNNAAFAQKELPSESVTITKDFDARLLESNKINVNPELPPLDTTTQRQMYLVPPRPLNITYDAPKLRPVGMKAGKKEEVYNGYAKLGGGVPKSLYAEAGYYLKAGDKFDGKVWFRHHSMSADRNIENQKFFNNDFLLNGNAYLSKNIAVEGKIGYSYDRVHFYGYDHDSLSFSAERTRQDFKIVDIGARVYNSERTNGDINFAVAPKLYTLIDYFSNKETGFDLNLTASKWFAEKHPLRLTIRTDLTKFNDTTVQNLNNIYLQPSFTFHTDFLKVKIGANFASNRDVFSIFPDCEITLRVFGDGIQIFAGATGDLRKNTYRSISDYNPFIQIRNTKLRNTRYDNYYGGLKGNLGWLDYTAQVGYGKAADLALFQTLFTNEGITRFQVLYDTARIFNLQGTVKLSPVKNLVLTGTLSQNVYDLNKEITAWGLPELEGTFAAVYTLLDGKANLRSSLHIADRISRINAESVRGQDGALIDLNIGGAYYFTKNIGAFLDINNILNNRRERWYTYPTIGTNFLVGITARF